MYSLFQKTLKDTKSDQRLKKSSSTNQLASSREMRLTKIATSTSPKLIESNPQSVMKTGVIPHFHPSTIEYREKPYKDNIYIRKYQKFRYKPEKLRISESAQDYKANHLETGKYFKLREDYLRESSRPFISSKRFE